MQCQALLYRSAKLHTVMKKIYLSMDATARLEVVREAKASHRVSAVAKRQGIPRQRPFDWVKQAGKDGTVPTARNTVRELVDEEVAFEVFRLWQRLSKMRYTHRWKGNFESQANDMVPKKLCNHVCISQASSEHRPYLTAKWVAEFYQEHDIDW